MSDNLKYINIVLESWGILFCVVAIIVLLIGTKIEKKTRNSFFSLFLCLAADLCCNITGLITKGSTDPSGRVLVRVANFGEFFELLAVVSVCLIYFAYPRRPRKQKKSGVLLDFRGLSCFFGIYGYHNPIYRLALYD